MTFRIWLTREAVVYRAYDAEGSLLYVGRTASLAKRLYQHSREASWWREVARIDIDGPLCQVLAEKVERHQIMTLAPRHNKAWNVHRGWSYGGKGSGLRYYPAKDEFLGGAQLSIWAEAA